MIMTNFRIEQNRHFVPDLKAESLSDVYTLLLA